MQSGGEVEISGEPAEVIEAAQPTESAGIVEWGIAAETDTETGGEADVVRNGQEPVQLRAIGPGLAANVLVEDQRAIDEWQLVIVDVRELAKFAEEPAGLQFEIPGQGSSLQGRLLDAHGCLAGFGVR